jgi:ATP adenylyltransferase
VSVNEFHSNLWAPWRLEYVQQIAEEPACFLCDYRDHPESDSSNHVVWRTDNSFVLLNRFPYTNGHLLIATLAHKADLSDLSSAELTSIMAQTRDAKRLLEESLRPHGFNIGINFGRCAGAGLPGHLHVHIVPRWNGDTNFMAVLGDVRVIPQALERLYIQLRETAARLGLPAREP